jgi:hypothetical protein
MVNINADFFNISFIIYFSNFNYVLKGKLLDVHHALGLIECDYCFHTILHIHNTNILILDNFFQFFIFMSIMDF